MKSELPDQCAIRLVLQRGGTSRGLFLRDEDLPPVGADRDRLLVRLMGSPDVLQIDGLGGSRPITSKIAIVAPSTRDDADVDYTFAQVDPATGGIGYAGNCGNISAGVGPFAVDERMVDVREGVTTVRIFNTNTRRVIVAEVPVVGGMAATKGDFVVPGVPGSGAEIVMNWRDMVGTATGRLLPTGNAVDTIIMADGRSVEASLVDAANPCVFVRGANFGLTGREQKSAVDGDSGLLADLRELRGKAAVLFGLVDDWRSADRLSAGLPMLGLVSNPTDYRTINGAEVAAGKMDLRLHLIFLGSLHESVAGTASVCLGAASHVPGSVVMTLAHAAQDDLIRIGHPSGITPVRVRARSTPEPPFVEFEELGFSRTARRLMEGHAFYPRSILCTS